MKSISLAVLALSGAIAAFGQYPSITTIGPDWAPVNTSRAITIVGSDFNSGTICSIDYSYGGTGPGPTDFPCTAVSDKVLTGTLPANATVTLGLLTVRNGESSAYTYFTVRSAVSTIPALTALSVNSRVFGSASFTLGLTGNFSSDMNFYWIRPGFNPQQLNLVSTPGATSAQVTIPNNLLATTGIAYVYGMTPGASSAPYTTALLPFSVVAPSITSLSITTAPAGSPSFSMNVNGAFQTPGSDQASLYVYFDGPAGYQSLEVTAATATQLTVFVPSGALTLPGVAQVSALSSSGATESYSESNQVPFTITQPAPVIGSVNPATVLRGAATTSFTISGSNFTPANQSVTFTPPGGSATSVGITGAPNSTSIVVSVPSNLLTVAGTGTFRVTTTGGGPSNAGSISIVAPVITSLTPNSVAQGSATTNVTIAGTGFTLGGAPTATWIPPGGTPTTGLTVQPTPSNTGMVVTVPNTLLTAAGGAGIFVTTGTAVSNTASFTITAAAPTLTSSNPANIAQNTAMSITLNGTNLSPLTSVTFTPVNGQPVQLTPTSASSTAITVALQAINDVNVGIGVFTVTTPVAPPATLSVPVVAPAITLVSPTSVVKGSQSALITLTGSFNVGGFTGVGRWISPSSGPTTDFPLAFPSAGVATFTIGAAEMANGGTAVVRVVAGGAISNALTVQVVEPSISTVTPPSSQVTSAALPITIAGTNFTAGGTPIVRFTPPGGSPAVLTINGSPTATSISATITAGLLNNPGQGSITVQSGTATSPPVSFAINATPFIEYISPSVEFAGSPDVLLTVYGGNFTAGGSPTVRWINGNVTQNLTLSGSPSNTQINAIVPAVLLASPGSAGIEVQVGNGTSGRSTFVILPTPVLTSLTPSSATAGGAAFTLTINGANLAQSGYGVTVRFNTTDLSPATANASAITVNVPANLIAAPGSFPVTVRLTPQVSILGASAPRRIAAVGRISAEVGNVSNALPFVVNGAAPVLSSLSPNPVTAGGAAFNLTIAGSGFTLGDTVDFNGTSITPSSVTQGQLVALVPAAAILTPGVKNVRVLTSAGVASNTLTERVNYNITSLNPSFATAGGATFPLTVNATAVLSGAQIVFNGTTLQTVSFTGTSVTANVPGSLIANASIVPVSITDGTLTSNSLSFNILGPVNVTSINPTFAQAGGPAFTLTVNGSGFDAESTVLANGSPITSAFVSATQMTATVSAGLIATPGSIAIGVRDARSRTSNSINLPVLAPIVISSLSPNTRDAGSGAFLLTVSGSGYESISVINFNGTALGTTFVNAGQLTATVPANLIASAAIVNVTVSDNRGRASAPAAFNILTPLSITSLSPSFVEAGAGAFTLTLNGTGFANGMNVLFGGTSIAATVANTTQAAVQIPANLVTTVGAVPVQAQVANSVFQAGAPGTRTSNTVNFNVLAALQLTSVNPSRANAGIPAFTLAVSGLGFTQGATIRFNNSNLTTTLVNTGLLTGLVTPAQLAAPGTVEVRVQLTDGRISQPLPFTILPQLRITSISPAAVAAGANTFTMTVNGEGFTSESVVRIGGFGLATTFVSSTQLTALVGDSLIANPLTADVTVANPLNAISNSISFSAGGTISITSVNPPGAASGSNGLSISVSGSGFTQSTVVRFGTSDLATAFVNSTQLNATIPASLLVTPGVFGISAAAGSTVSNSVNFEVSGRPELTFLNPDAVTAGSRGITLIALGRGFLPGAILKFGDADIPTTFASGTQVSGAIPASLLTTARTVAVTVVNSNGQVTNSREFRIAALTLTSLTPDKATAGGPAFTLALEGTGFISGAIASFGGRALITSFGGTTRLSAQVPADAILSAGSINVTVSNPDGAVSNALPFTVESDLPTISRLNPASVVAGSGEVTVAVTGGGFVRGASVLMNGSVLATTFNSSTSLDAVVPASLTQTIRNLPVKVVNPGNKESNELTFSVAAPTPAITSINPATVNAGSTVDVPISIVGSGFVQGSSVTFNGGGVETSFNSATSLSAVIPAGSLVTPGNAAVQVINPGNLQSNTVQFTIAGTVSVTSVNPGSLASGGASDPVITVTGTGFVNGSTVRFGGAGLATAFGSATQLTATVPQNLLTTARDVAISVANPNGAVSNSVNLVVTAPVPALNLDVPATITPAGSGRVQVTLGAPAPVALQGTLSIAFVNNSNNAPAGYVDPALAFAGADPGQPRTINFTIPQGGTAAVIGGNGAFSPGTVAGTIVVTMTSLTGGGQNLLPSPAPARNVVLDRSAPVVVAGSVRITTIAGGLQVVLSGISSPRDLRTIAYTFTAGSTSILEGASLTVDVSQLFTTYFTSDSGRAAGGTFGFTMPFTVSGGDAAAVTQVTVTLTNSVGTSQAVSGGR
jgi:hypothetical protein